MMRPRVLILCLLCAAQYALADSAQLKINQIQFVGSHITFLISPSGDCIWSNMPAMGLLGVIGVLTSSSGLVMDIASASDLSSPFSRDTLVLSASDLSSPFSRDTLVLSAFASSGLGLNLGGALPSPEELTWRGGALSELALPSTEEMTSRGAANRLQHVCATAGEGYDFAVAFENGLVRLQTSLGGGDEASERWLDVAVVAVCDLRTRTTSVASSAGVDDGDDTANRNYVAFCTT